MSGAPTWRGGGCHCGAVRFEAQLPDRVRAAILLDTVKTSLRRRLA